MKYIYGELKSLKLVFDFFKTLEPVKSIYSVSEHKLESSFY